jgi:hypothetical protein
MPIARRKLIIDVATGTVCARGAPADPCRRPAPGAGRAVAASSLRFAANAALKKRR